LILRAIAFTLLALLLLGLTVAAWEVGEVFLLSAVIAGSVYAIWQVTTRIPSPPSEEPPPAVQEEPPEPQPKLWTPRPRARGDEPDAP
jgi:hypothetical protein